jgi:peptide subunit release factor 1 (eRF1)
MRAGILIADRAQARTFVSSANLLDEVGEPLVADIGKSNYGGFAGYDEHVVRARAYEESARLWRSAGQRLLEVHQAKPFDYLAIGGHEESVEEVARSLHPYLERLPRESFTMDPGKITTQALRTEIETMDSDHRRQRQTALAGRVCDTAWGGGNAVLGLNRVLAAANTRAIEVLVVAGDFTRPGRVCGRCGRLSRSEQTCPVCGAITFEVDDLVAAAMDSVIESGGRVSQVSIASPLDTDGIGALTRFPVPI